MTSTDAATRTWVRDPLGVFTADDSWAPRTRAAASSSRAG